MKGASADALGPQDFTGPKTEAQKNLINEALEIIGALRVPLESSEKRLERMALAFLAVCDVSRRGEWTQAKDASNSWSLQTRDIITYMNDNFGEDISPGSYDDVRRKDLLLLTTAGIIVGTAPGSARNSPSRGYALAPHYTSAVRSYGTDHWKKEVGPLCRAKNPSLRGWTHLVSLNGPRLSSLEARCSRSGQEPTICS